jgi:hypothetical protein
MIQMNAIANDPVTTEDIELAQQIFGQSIRSLKGKTTRRKPIPVAYDYIKIPIKLTTKQQDMILCIDSIKVNGLTFLTTVSKNICYRTAQFVIDKSVNSSKAALHEVIQLYNKAGFHIKEIRCNNKFKPLQNTLYKTYEIEMNFSNTQEHIPEAK